MQYACTNLQRKAIMFMQRRSKRAVKEDCRFWSSSLRGLIDLVSTQGPLPVWCFHDAHGILLVRAELPCVLVLLTHKSSQCMCTYCLYCQGPDAPTELTLLRLATNWFVLRRVMQGDISHYS